MCVTFASEEKGKDVSRSGKCALLIFIFKVLLYFLLRDIILTFITEKALQIHNHKSFDGTYSYMRVLSGMLWYAQRRLVKLVLHVGGIAMSLRNTIDFLP